jgi:hypothetical protein
MDGCEHNVLVDGACLCQPGAQQACYQGAPGTQGVGLCKAGVQTCAADGTSWGACIGQVLPVAEICSNNVDEDCNGVVDDVPDIDGDGWTACNGDCCETLAQCGTPKLVNPGAFEVIGDGIDNDCDPATSDVVAPAACSTVAKLTGVTATDVAKAMDICQTTTANPPLNQKKWGLITGKQLNADLSNPSAAQLSDMQNWQSAVRKAYGTGGVVPKNGPTFAGISSGRMRTEGEMGYVDPNSGTDFASASNPPAVFLSQHGGSLPAAQSCNGNCPAGSGANDSVDIQLQIRVPTNAQSLSYDFRYFTSEYWSWTCTPYNDFYLALMTSGAPGIPADHNISFDSLHNPVSVNNGFFEVCQSKGCYTCPSGTASLAGSGMEKLDSIFDPGNPIAITGGGTTWLTTDAPVVPGETITLDFMVFDVSDGILDSATILDNFRWSLSPAVVGTHQ